MSNKEQLLADAKELGLEFTEGATEAEIQSAIDQKLGEENATTTPENEENGADEPQNTNDGEDVTPIEPTPTEPEGEDVTPPVEPEKTPEEVEAEAKAAEEAEAARQKEEAEAQAAIEEQKRLEEEAKAEKPSEGSEIAAAIREGLTANKEDKRIKITADKHVKSMFSVVRNKRTGEVMLRENSTGTLSKVQLESLEEKEASLQDEEVEEL